MVSQKPNDQFRTPEVLFQRYNERYAFTVDGAANEQDTLCSTWWGPGGGPWHGRDGVEDFFSSHEGNWMDNRVWINPPYSMIPEFLDHALKFRKVCPVTCWLLPAWTDRLWWHRFIGRTGPYPHSTWEFLPGRVEFLLPDGTPPVGKDGHKQRGQFPSVVVTWHGGLSVV